MRIPSLIHLAQANSHTTDTYTTLLVLMPHYWYLHQILIFILHIGLHLKTSIPCHKFTELVVDLVDDLVDVGRKLLLAVLQLFGVLLLPLRQLNNFDGQPVPENKQKIF